MNKDLETSSVPDRYLLVCNYLTQTSEFRKGTLCYIVLLNAGNNSDRIKLFGRSRGGRWIQKWEDIRRLTNFRIKTISAFNSLCKKVEMFGYETTNKTLLLQRLNEIITRK